MERRRNKKRKYEELYGDDQPYDAQIDEMDNDNFQHEKIMEKIRAELDE